MTGLSRGTNQPHLLAPGDDTRRKFKDLVLAILSDQGGVEQLSRIKVELIRRFATSVILAEQVEEALVLGKPVDIASHVGLVNCQSGLASKIGLKRVSRDVNLRTYLAERATVEIDADDAD